MQFSPGILQGGMSLLDLLSRRQLSVLELRQSFTTLGGLSATHAINVAMFLRWISIDADGSFGTTPDGERMLTIDGYEQRLRQAILDYIDAAAPAWLQTASFGRKRLLAFAGNQVGQVFLEAGLIEGIDNAVVSFWDSLAARARGQRDDLLIATGRKGERLSLLYEHQRTGQRPKWVAIDNNADGYDVLSIVSAENFQKLSIEVKASTSGLQGKFHLTRNEWERAQDALYHEFHLWAFEGGEVSLAVLQTSDIVPNVPEDRGGGSWSVAELDFSLFAPRFTRYENGNR